LRKSPKEVFSCKGYIYCCELKTFEEKTGCRLFKTNSYFAQALDLIRQNICFRPFSFFRQIILKRSDSKKSNPSRADIGISPKGLSFSKGLRACIFLNTI